MGRTLWWLATEVIVKILRRCRLYGFERINGDHLRGTMVWIQEDTERDYSQIEYGTNSLVVGNGGDGENPRRR
jgi:hypothetical protein